MSNQSNQPVSENTLIRNFQFGKGMDIVKITQIQNAYINKDTKKLKELFGKPRNFKNKTIMAYGSNVVQYVNRLDNPTNNVKQFVQRKYNIQLSNDLHANYIKMGNIKPIKPPPTQSLKDIVNPNGFSYYEDYRYAQTQSPNNPSKTDLQNAIIKWRFSNGQIQIMKRKHKVEKMRLFINLGLENRNKQIVSTPVVDLDEFQEFDLLFMQYQVGALVNPTTQPLMIYDVEDGSGTVQQLKVKGIVNFWVRFYKQGY